MTDNKHYKRAVRARMAETGEKYTQALRRIKEQELLQTPVVPTTPWDYISMIPRGIVENLGWAKVVEQQHDIATRAAWYNGISAKRLGTAVRCEQASWVIGDDGEPVPHAADGTETWYSVRLCYSVQPKDEGVDKDVDRVRQ